MDPRVLCLAGTLLVAHTPIAAAEAVRHPAEPGRATPAGHKSPFAAGVPLLERSAPRPSYEGADDESAPPAADRPGSSHGATSHGVMSHGTAGHRAGHAGMHHSPAGNMPQGGKP